MHTKNKHYVNTESKGRKWRITGSNPSTPPNHRLNISSHYSLSTVSPRSVSQPLCFDYIWLNTLKMPSAAARGLLKLFIGDVLCFNDILTVQKFMFKYLLASFWLVFFFFFYFLIWSLYKNWNCVFLISILYKYLFSAYKSLCEHKLCKKFDFLLYGWVLYNLQTHNDTAQSSYLQL